MILVIIYLLANLTTITGFIKKAYNIHRENIQSGMGGKAKIAGKPFII